MFKSVQNPQIRKSLVTVIVVSVSLVLVSIGVCLFTIFGGVHYCTPVEIPVEVEKIVEKTVEVEKIVEVPVEVEKIVEKTVEVEKIVEVPVEVEKIVEINNTEWNQLWQVVGVGHDVKAVLIASARPSGAVDLFRWEGPLPEDTEEGMNHYSEVLSEAGIANRMGMFLDPADPAVTALLDELQLDWRNAPVINK